LNEDSVTHKLVEAVGVLLRRNSTDSIAIDQPFEAVFHLFSGVKQRQNVDYADEIALGFVP
jgi:hypothetical protein